MHKLDKNVAKMYSVSSIPESKKLLEEKSPELKVLKAGKFIRLSINKKDILVPEETYIKDMESKIDRQKRDINDLQQANKIIVSELNACKKLINQLKSEMKNKLDYRD